MNCVYHPERNAETACGSCGKPLCRTCAIGAGAKPGVLCSRCSALNAAEDATRGVHQRQAEKKEKNAVIISPGLKDFSRLRGGFKFKYQKLISLPVKEPDDFTPGMRLVHGASPSGVESLWKSGVGRMGQEAVREIDY